VALLTAEGLRLRYDDELVLRDVSFEVEAGEVLALLGPSGCGKTSILRVVAGLEPAEAGVVRLDGNDLAAVPSHRRGFGLMFQEFALFPHLRVEQNIDFGLRMQGLGGDERRERVADLLTIVGLTGYESRQVHQLSGGERQRVALARSLAPRPRLLMLDEPMGALDRGLRDTLLLELRRILTELGQTSIYVTHDQDEAFSLADRVLIMERGEIRQSGTPEAIFRQPVDAFVARFIGLGNLIEAQIEDREGATVARTTIGDFALLPHVDAPRGRATLLIGDERAQLERVDGGVDRHVTNSFLAQVRQRSFRGRRLTFRVQAGEATFLFEADTRPQHQAIREGDNVLVTVDPEALRVLA
jgi:ABC-type Fe3+/spermidine/putrescine transport system ATPase subunit